MRLRWWHRRRSAPKPRASQVAIKVLEHDLYGTPVEPGSTANAFLGLRALATAGTTSREMMRRMTDCTATGTITLDGQPTVVICNWAPHEGTDHNDNVLGGWTSHETATPARG